MPRTPSKSVKLKTTTTSTKSFSVEVKGSRELSLIRPTLALEKSSMKPMSNSRLEDLTQCPTWGHVHSRKRYATLARAMALEAGELMHRVFATVRIWQLWRLQKLEKHAMFTGARLFGPMWTHILKAGEEYRRGDPRDQLLNMCFATLHNAGWEDSPTDATRTMGNMELATIAYVDERFENFNNWPVWVANKKDPKCQVGIEQVFDVVLEYADGYKVRYVGTDDGLHLDMQNGGRLCLEDNKTTIRMDEGLRQSFVMKHQFTGYMACSTCVFGFPVYVGRVWGVKIKYSQKGENCMSIPIERDFESIAKWGSDVRWVMENMHDPFDHDYGYEGAPRFTHSCNRYFRACALLPFCADNAAGRVAAYDEMVPVDPSPSERAVLDV